MKRKKLKKSIKKLLIFMLIILLFKILFIGKKTTKETPVGSYTCVGGIIKICNGSQEVADYLGVE